MSSGTKDHVRRAHWAAAAGLFFGSMIIDLLDGHSPPAVEALVDSSQLLAVVLVIVGCIMLVMGRLDHVVRELVRQDLARAKAVPIPNPRVYQLGVMEGQRRARNQSGD